MCYFIISFEIETWFQCQLAADYLSVDLKSSLFLFSNLGGDVVIVFNEKREVQLDANKVVIHYKFGSS